MTRMLLVRGSLPLRSPEVHHFDSDSEEGEDTDRGLATVWLISNRTTYKARKMNDSLAFLSAQRAPGGE